MPGRKRNRGKYRLLRSFFRVINTAETVLLHRQKDIVGKAMESGNLNTWIMALEEADLVDTLREEGPYTVFAPTDTAFKKLPAGTMDSLMNDKERLRAVLSNHIVAGKIMARDALTNKTATTLQGGELSFDTCNGLVLNGEAKVIEADIEAKNGVCHAIDTVIIPTAEEQQ